jgi:hypothetical protein
MQWFSKEGYSIPDLPPYAEKARPEIPSLDRFVVFEKTDIFLVSFLLVSLFFFFFYHMIGGLESKRVAEWDVSETGGAINAICARRASRSTSSAWASIHSTEQSLDQNFQFARGIATGHRLTDLIFCSCFRLVEFSYRPLLSHTLPLATALQHRMLGCCLCFLRLGMFLSPFLVFAAYGAPWFSLLPGVSFLLLLS